MSDIQITPAEVDQKVYDTYAQHGYINENGTVNVAEIRKKIFAEIRSRQVADLAGSNGNLSRIERVKLLLEERNEKAVTPGELVTAVFPHLPQPDEQEDPRLARAVWSAITKKMWAMASRVGPHSWLYGIVRAQMGNGTFPCLTDVARANNRTRAIYITSEPLLLQRDIIDKEEAAVLRRHRSAVDYLTSLMRAHPDQALAWKRSYETASKAALDEGSARLKVALESPNENESVASDS